MTLRDTLRTAMRALFKNKMRAGLTVLGVVIGIAAVTTMVSIGQSAGAMMQAQFESLGANMVVIMPANARQGPVREGYRPTLTPQDALAIVDECPSVFVTSPIVNAQGQVIYGNSNWSPQELQGVGVDFLQVSTRPLKAGTFFTEQDITGANKVCVIGHTLVAELFQTENPIGATVRIKNIPFRVIGVLEAKGANMMGQDQDNILLMPYTAVRKRLQGSAFSNVDLIVASARTRELMPQAVIEVETLLRERHRINEGQRPDFEVFDTTQIANVLNIITGSLTLMLSAIAAISLVVGGVGIMNIMLVSVTERTREIGVRMAVGARPRDILRQFLVESVLLSTMGGLVGFGLGVGAAASVTTAINSFSGSGVHWPMVISFPAGVVAVIFSAAVGIFFGFYPARRAARLDPIDALRYE
ncbi:MAG: ABC transporter permease [Planctomyces sp.]|nr:ABC transporter permease [Planctomyces sp.]